MLDGAADSRSKQRGGTKMKTKTNVKTDIVKRRDENQCEIRRRRMTYCFSTSITRCLLAAMTVAALAQNVSFAGVQLGAAPKSTPNPNSNQYGELSAVWWQWIYSFPAAMNPNLATGPVDCSFGQSSHSRPGLVWFLAGSF